MRRLRLYRVLVGSLGVASLVFGLALVGSFFAYQRPGSTPMIPTGPIGHYFVAFTGCALIGWAGGLIGAARDPWSSRSVGTMTAFVLALMAVIRMVVWLVGDYSAWLGDLPRQEAAVLLLIALALVWLRPTVAESVAGSPASSSVPVAAPEEEEEG
ncbi:MAG: hypothetical protein JRF61_09625 [Deltaproteobacteria bacterium]|jgi:hypothetical protein|nr:hypothetical protein [Deltaproteobacteria bacterium]